MFSRSNQNESEAGPCNVVFFACFPERVTATEVEYLGKLSKRILVFFLSYLLANSNINVSKRILM